MCWLVFRGDGDFDDAGCDAQGEGADGLGGGEAGAGAVADVEGAAVQGAHDAVTAHAAFVESGQCVGAAVFDGEVLVPEPADDDLGTVYFKSREAFFLDTFCFCNGCKKLLRHHVSFPFKTIECCARRGGF
jgi:hypothetical protein